MIEEVWKDVVGFEEYFRVSNTGRVWSKRTNKLIKQTKLDSGYLVVNTRIGGREGICYSLRVHRMVAEAFLETPDQHLIEKCSKEGHGKVLVCHKDNNKENNTYLNLKWGSSEDNSSDFSLTQQFKENILKMSGVLNCAARFTLEDVEYIKNVYTPRDKEYGCRALAKKFNVNHKLISNIVNNKTYK